jgi:SH3-like domain-containing protein
MRRRAILIYLILFVCPLVSCQGVVRNLTTLTNPEPSRSQPQPPVPERVLQEMIQVDCGNIRTRPTTRSYAITQVYHGQMVRIMGSITAIDGTWYEVITPSGQRGWAHEVLFRLKPTKPVVVAPRPVAPPPPKEEPPIPPPEADPDTPPTQVTAKTEEGMQTPEMGPEREDGSSTTATTEPTLTPTSPAPGSDEENKPTQIASTNIETEEPPTVQTDTTPADTDEGEPDRTSTVQSPRPQPDYIYIADSGPAAILAEPSALSEIIGSIPPGTKVALIEKSESFYLLEYQSKRGYVHKPSCQEIPDPQPELKENPAHDSTKPIANYVRIWDKDAVGLLKKPNAFALIIVSIPAGTRVEYSKKEGNFYKVEYRGETGYLYKGCCEEMD